MWRAKTPRVTSCFAYLSLLPSALQTGARGFQVSLNTWYKLSFPFCYRYFSSHVTRGAGPRLRRRLLGSSRPSTRAGPGLRETVSDHFFLLWAACFLWVFSPNTVCEGAVPSLCFNRY